MQSRTIPNKSNANTYIIQNSRQLDAPKKSAETSNSNVSSPVTTHIAANLSNIPRLADPTFSPILFNTKKIERAVSDIKPTYQPGSDGVSPALFHFGKPYIAILLLNLFTISISTGLVPVQWKVLIIVLPHKTGYCTTPILARLMEKVVEDQLIVSFWTSGSTGGSQYGFFR